MLTDSFFPRILSRFYAQIIALAVFMMVLYFDLQTKLPLGDEWMFRWSFEKFAQGKGLHLWPGLIPFNILEDILALPIYWLNSDPRLIRLVVIPFLILLAIYTRKIALYLGASIFWANIAALAVACSPLTLSVGSGFMSDISYLALMMMALFYALKWIQEGKYSTGAISACILASLQRQQGMAITFGIILFLLLQKNKKLNRKDWLSIGVLIIGTFSAIYLPYRLGISSSHLNNLSENFFHLNVLSTLAHSVEAIFNLPIMIGLISIPFALGLAHKKNERVLSKNKLPLVFFAIGLIGLFSSVFFILIPGASIFPGDYLHYAGLGPLFLIGAKTPVLPLPFFRFLELLCIFSFSVLLIWKHKLWTPERLKFSGIVLIMLGFFQLGTALLYPDRDRHFLAVVVPIIPLVASWLPKQDGTSRTLPLAKIWAISTILLGVIFYGVAQQDYIAWHIAIEQTIEQIPSSTPLINVDLGYEGDGVFVQIPAFEKTGTMPFNPTYSRPPHPKWHLVFASSNDPRPGVSYTSIASGKIILQKEK